MIDVVLDLLRCPHCGGALARQDATVRCAGGHAFDLARQGYLNLLGRASPAHADTADMVAARERFLGRGHYAPIAATLAAALTEAGRGAGTVLEVGAGTGYYLSHLLAPPAGRSAETESGPETLAFAEDPPRGVALDISAAACRRAARADARIGAAVADAWGVLPVPDACMDVVLSVFAPRNAAEFARVLTPEGLLLIASPLPDHLQPLRGRLGLLDIEPGKDERLAGSLARDFTLAGQRDRRYELLLDADAVVDLVSMGPNAFHHDRSALSRQVGGLRLPAEVTVAVSVSAWRPLGRPAPAGR